MNELSLPDFLFVAIDPHEQEISPADCWRVNKTLQQYTDEQIDGEETMDILETLGIPEPHLFLANQFEIMEVMMSKCF